MTRATDRRAVLGAVLAAGAAASTAAIPAVAEPALDADRPDYQRALPLWNRWLKQVDRYNTLSDQCTPDEIMDRELDVLNEIEDALHDDMGESVHALAAVLMIEIRNGGGEDVDGLQLASLAAIRPQLVGAIAEEADRVLAEEEADA